MNRYTSILLACGLSAMALAGCKKVTEQINPSGITANNFYKNGADADVAINSCYDAFQNPDRYVIWGDARTDLFAVTDRTTTDLLQLVNGASTANSSYGNWDNMYSAIKRANSVLKNVPLIADPSLDSRRARILGEAYFLRAMAYFYLVRTFDNVPLILEPYENLNQDFYPTQATPEQVFAQVEADLLEAQKRLTDRPFSTEKEFRGKASLGSVRAALADVYLWERKYTEAADAALLVINSSAAYRLVSGANFGTIFFNKNTTESIWEIQFDNTLLEPNNNNLTDLFLPLPGANYAGGNWYLQPSLKLTTAYVAADLRGPVTIRNTGSPAAPFRDVNLRYVNKYLGTLGNQNATRFQDSNQIIYRLAEVILMRAEALNNLGRTAEAIPLVNQLRTRAGLPATTAASAQDVALAIENERFLELAFEGKRYFDLKRTGRYAAVTGFTNPNWLRWPINADEITRNGNLRQNPGY